MDIRYTEERDFTEKELKNLFLSVKWSSGEYPDRLLKAMQGFSTVYSAWRDEELVGMVCVMDDGVMTAYIHYLLVNPKYHNNEIGRTLIDMVKKKYSDYLRIALISYDDEVRFYKNCGFTRGKNCTPMFITSLGT
ncbi:MAG: GNAT family N-acetyltransferase [Lachnospiraceae bacterium]|nr:GNAT family N-acetyltransferase [Lachnospiraceae bacterium]